MVRRTRRVLLGGGCVVVVALFLACGSSDDAVRAPADAAAETKVTSDGAAPDRIAADDGGSDAPRPACVESELRFCDDFDAPDGGLSKWSFLFVDDGGAVELANAGAVSPPRHLRTRMTDAGYPPGEYAAIMKTLGGAPEVTYAADVRVVTRPDAGECSCISCTKSRANGRSPSVSLHKAIVS
jgi:hypothetical protein